MLCKLCKKRETDNTSGICWMCSVIWMFFQFQKEVESIIIKQKNMENEENKVEASVETPVETPEVAEALEVPVEAPVE